MRTLELYFNDLTPEAQKKYLEVAGVSSAEELNWEVTPIATIEVEEEPLIKGSFSDPNCDSHIARNKTGAS